MEIKISLDESTEKGKKVLQFLEDIGVSYSPTTLTAKDAAFGIGRKATDEELEEYLKRCLNSELADIDDILNED